VYQNNLFNLLGLIYKTKYRGNGLINATGHQLSWVPSLGGTQFMLSVFSMFYSPRHLMPKPQLKTSVQPSTI